MTADAFDELLEIENKRYKAVSEFLYNSVKQAGKEFDDYLDEFEERESECDEQ